jgi:hypothetical protein
MQTDFGDDNKFIDLIESNDIVSTVFIDDHKLVKVTSPCNIYRTKCSSVDTGKIYLDSLAHELVNHKKDYDYLSLPIDYKEKLKLFNNHLSLIKNNIYLTSPDMCRMYDYVVNYQCNKTIEMNCPIFVNTHTEDSSFIHELAYGITQIYNYYRLFKFIPDLKLVLKYCTTLTKHILDVLNIKDFILLKKDEQIINKGTTFFSGHWNANVSKNIIDGFYYDIIVQNTFKLYGYPDVFNLPKKIIMLRHPNNIITEHYIKNRGEICKLASQYGYIEVDQTKLSFVEVIKLINNATHIIQETGSSMGHLLWSNKNVKSILINYQLGYCYICSKNRENFHEYFKTVSDNMHQDIVESRNCNVIFNDEQFIQTTIPSEMIRHDYFDNLHKIEQAIIEFE